MKFQRIRNTHYFLFVLFFPISVLSASVTNAQSNFVSYTQNQALSGQEIYETRCASCHGINALCCHQQFDANDLF